MSTAPRARLSIVSLTPAAEEHLAEIMANAPEGVAGVKLSTPKSGCSGLGYSVDYAMEAEIGPFDERIDFPGGTLFIEAASTLNLIGTTMDWRVENYAASFVFDNPNAKASCACGNSFATEEQA